MEEKEIQTSKNETELEGLSPEEKPEEETTEVGESEEVSDEGGETEETSQGVQSQEETPEIDYKKKFAESAREAQILLAKYKQLEEKLGKIESAEIPVEEELKRIYPDWDIMSDLEKKLAKGNLILERRLSRIENKFDRKEEEEEWERKLNNFLEKSKVVSKYPELEGRELEFRKFAEKPTHKGVSLDVLAKAFLFEIETPPTKKGSVLERGSGGVKETPKKKISPEELRIIREKDEKKWREIITKHPNWIEEV